MLPYEEVGELEFRESSDPIINEVVEQNWT